MKLLAEESREGKEVRGNIWRTKGIWSKSERKEEEEEEKIRNMDPEKKQKKGYRRRRLEKNKVGEKSKR